MLNQRVKEVFTSVAQQDSDTTVATLLSTLTQENEGQFLVELEEVASAKKFSPLGLMKLPLLLYQVAYLNPEKMLDVLDHTFAAFLSSSETTLPDPGKTPLSLPKEDSSNFERVSVPAALNELYWKHVLAPPVVSQLIADFGKFNTLLPLQVKAAYSRAMAKRPGLEEAFEQAYQPPTLEFDSLKACPIGSLGQAFLHYIGANKIKLDFTNGSLPAPISALTDYVGVRIVQTHDLWHVIMGYSNSGPDELALLGFQSAQLGTTFSTHILSIAIAKAVLLKPQLVLPYITPIAQGWQHGRQTTPLLPMRWEEMWELPLEEIQHSHKLIPKPALAR